MTTTITNEAGITYVTKTADRADLCVREERHASKGEGHDHRAIHLIISAAGECGLALTAAWTMDGGRHWTRGKRTYHRTVAAGMAAADVRWAKLLTRLA